MSVVLFFVDPRLIRPDLKPVLKDYIILVGKYSILGNFLGQNTFSKIVALIV